VTPPVGQRPDRGETAADRPVVRRQDLRSGKALQRVAQCPPLAHAGTAAEAVAGERDVRPGIGGGWRGRHQGDQAGESRQDQGDGNDACEDAAPSGRCGVDTADGSHEGTDRGGRQRAGQGAGARSSLPRSLTCSGWYIVLRTTTASEGDPCPELPTTRN